MILNSSIPFKGVGLKVKLFLMVMALLFSLSGSLLVTNAAEATLTLDKTTIRLGEPILISGSGYSAGEKLSVWLTGPSGGTYDGAYLNANSAGSFTSFPIGGGNTDLNNITIANHAGTWAVTVQGSASGLIASATFTVLSPNLTLTGNNLGNNIFHVLYSGSNWFPSEKVSLWVTFPDGTVTGLDATFADGDGNIPSPANNGFAFTGSVGAYTVTAQGSTSRNPITLQFSIIPATN
ncbi:MAG: hypothetical protein WCS37_09625 [Chloroflexota bacterium]|nr:hypothetical protein [Chloroflexota bacterium]